MNLALTAIELVLLLIPVLIASYFLAQYLAFRRLLSRLVEHKEGETSEMGSIIDSVAGSFGRAVAIEAKTSLMGKASALSRQESAIEEAVLKDTQPALWGLLQAMPSVRKIVNKNPALLGLVGNYLASKTNGGGGSSGVSEQVKFNL